MHIFCDPITQTIAQSEWRGGQWQLPEGVTVPPPGDTAYRDVMISMQTCLRLPVESAWVWVRAEESFRESRIPAECSHVQEVEQEEERAEMRVVRRWISHQVDSSAWPRNLAGNQV